MSKEDKSKEDKKDSVEVKLSPSIQPVYSDDLIKVALHEGVAKIFLGQYINGDELYHNSTITIPVQTLLSLKELMNDEKFIKDTKKFREE